LAKRRRRSSKRLNSAAVGLGASIGTLAGRVKALKVQQKAVADELRQVVATAQGMLADLGQEVSASAARGRRAGSAKKKRRLSPEGRANIIAAAKKRWAKYHAKNKKG